MHLLQLTLHSVVLVLTAGTLGTVAKSMDDQSSYTSSLWPISAQVEHVNRLLQYDYFSTSLPGPLTYQDDARIRQRQTLRAAVGQGAAPASNFAWPAIDELFGVYFTQAMYQLSRNLQHSDTSSDSADANDHLPATSMLGLPWDLPSDVNQRRYSLRLDRDALVKQLLHLPNPDDLNVDHEALMKSDRLFDLAQGLSSGYYQEVLEFINHFFRATNAPGLVTEFRTIPGTNYDAIIDLFFIQGTDDELRYILQGIMVYRIIPHLLATLVWDLRYQVIPAFVQALLAIPQLTSRLAEDPYIGINYMETAVILAASLDVPGDIGQAESDEDIDFIREVHREGSIWQYPRIYQCLLPYSGKKLPATNLLIMLGENEVSYYQWQSQSAFTYEHCEAWINSNTDLIDFNYSTFSLYFG